MKVLKYLGALSFLGVPLFLNAVQQEFFVEDIFVEEIPVSRAASYYEKERGGAGSFDAELEDWFNAPYAFGNAFGLRSMLEKYGVVPVITYLGNFAANPYGGDRQGAAISSSVNLGYGVDLYKLTNLEALKGWSFSMSATNFASLVIGVFLGGVEE